MEPILQLCPLLLCTFQFSRLWPILDSIKCSLLSWLGRIPGRVEEHLQNSPLDLGVWEDSARQSWAGLMAVGKICSWSSGLMIQYSIQTTVWAINLTSGRKIIGHLHRSHSTWIFVTVKLLPETTAAWTSLRVLLCWEDSQCCPLQFLLLEPSVLRGDGNFYFPEDTVHHQDQRMWERKLEGMLAVSPTFLSSSNNGGSRSYMFYWYCNTGHIHLTIKQSS